MPLMTPFPFPYMLVFGTIYSIAVYLLSCIILVDIIRILTGRITDFSVSIIAPFNANGDHNASNH